MKSLLFIAAVLFLSSTDAISQDDSTRYINGLPVSEDDTARQFLQADREPKNRLTEVPPNALPSKVLDVLNEDDQYRGWQDSTVYFESNTNLYLVPVKTKNGVKIFGLSKDGKPVTFDEVSPR